ncbi:MAG: hypothetical protein MI747_15910 [Desulfobacterales bacterium]|nr:hypothetical protein [Desulfobacterales bacterium]
MADVYAANNAISKEDAEKLVPRAEFRVFGQKVLDLVTTTMWKAQAKLFKIRTSGETYILSALTNEANVKIRDGLLDIKTKVSETEDGYEVFQPRGKFQFPVSKDELNKIFENLLVEIELDQDTYTLDQFISMVKAHKDLAAVDVQKERYGFSVDGMICEYGKILFNGAMLETACVESEDYEGMKKAIEALELTEMENVNYLKAAKRVIGMDA